MFKISRSLVFLFFLASLFLLSNFTPALYAGTKIQLPEPELIKADKKTVKELQRFYEDIGEALFKKDLDELMSFYADDFKYKAVTKAQVRGLWKDMFSQFYNLSSSHFFSTIVVNGTEATLMCTGVIMGRQKGGGDYEIVDSWAASNHFLSKKSGSWKIVGGSHTAEGKKALHQEEFHMEFHPFF